MVFIKKIKDVKSLLGMFKNLFLFKRRFICFYRLITADYYIVYSNRGVRKTDTSKFGDLRYPRKSLKINEYFE